MEKRRKKPYTFLEGEEEGGIGGVDDVADIENVMRWLLPGGGCSKVGVAPWLPRVEREGEEGLPCVSYRVWFCTSVLVIAMIIRVDVSRRRRAARSGAGRRKFGRNRSQDRRVGRSGNSLVVVGSEDFVRCNFFEWCSEEVIDSRNVVNVEDSSASARNEEVGRSLMKMEQSVMKMEERDVEKLKIGCLEKRMKVDETRMKVG
ncbi:hypothetical protein LR48_Vigan106s001400 [Vigna angularis]|uniref:Uncharacterized protein n=1 Tax=Phaseolus angularis TaxID=3914 RepID=A0A0L9T4F7_PHAAN|nr:hypothetical protein LR48_Vigan106s001400 [Vigna angularis]